MSNSHQYARPTLIRVVIAILAATFLLSVAISAGFLILAKTKPDVIISAMPGITIFTWLVTASIGLLVGVPGTYLLLRLGRFTRAFVLSMGALAGACISIAMIILYGDRFPTPARVAEWFLVTLLYAGIGFAASLLVSVLLPKRPEKMGSS